MKRKIVNILKIILTGVVLWGVAYTVYVLIILFNWSRAPVVVPERHPNVPENAIWYGAQDGGQWIIVEEHPQAEYFRIRVYHDFTGEQKVDGIFLLDSCLHGRSFNADSVNKYILGYDSFYEVTLDITKNGKYVSLYLINDISQ